MPDLRKLIEAVSGEKPSPERIARINAIAHHADIPANDAMFPILIALDAYYDAIYSTPERIKEAARQSVKILDKVTERAAEQAVEKTETKIEGAVASLMPAVRNAVHDAAKGAVDVVTATENLQTIILGAIAAVIIFALGVLEGSGILHVLMWGRMNIAAFTGEIAWGIGAGVAVAVLGLWSSIAFATDQDKIPHWIAAAVAGSIAAVMLLSAVNSAITYRLPGSAGPIDCMAVPLMPASPSRPLSAPNASKAPYQPNPLGSAVPH